MKILQTAVLIVVVALSASAGPVAWAQQAGAQKRFTNASAG